MGHTVLGGAADRVVELLHHCRKYTKYATNMATYKTAIIHGIVYRVKHWVEYFLDESTGERIPIKRSRPVKRDGKRCNQFGNFAKVS